MASLNFTVAILYYVLCHLGLCLTSADNNENANFTADEVDHGIYFVPGKILEIFMDSSSILRTRFNLNCNDTSEYTVVLRSERPHIAYISGESQYNLSCVSANHVSLTRINEFVNITVYGDLLGRTKLLFNVIPSRYGNDDNQLTLNDSTGIIFYKYEVIVTREPKALTDVFKIFITAFLILSTTIMGCKIDLSVVKKDLRKPVAPVIGLLCQYIIMPMIAYTLAMTVPFDDPIMKFGLFVLGCSPGGGSSNIYSYLLGGDVSLSITMTTISTIFALGMFPLWISTLGKTLIPEEYNIEIPFLDVFIAILMVVLPLIVGLVLQHKVPKFTAKLIKFSKPFLLILLITLLVLMLISNFYMFELFTPITLLAGSCLPYFGFILGGFIAWVARLPPTRIKTIALETGLQNQALAMIAVLLSLPTPDSEIAAVCPAISGLMSTFLVCLVTVVYMIWGKCRNRRGPAQNVDRTDDDAKVNGFTGAVYMSRDNGMGVGVSDGDNGYDQTAECTHL